MNTTTVIKTADAVLNEQIRVILAAQKAGDSKALSNALRVGGIASVVVEKSAMIAANPEKFERAAAESDIAKVLPNVAKIADERARAEGFLRFKSAYRAASQVRKVEGLLEKMSAAPAPRGRKSMHGVKSVE